MVVNREGRRIIIRESNLVAKYLDLLRAHRNPPEERHVPVLVRKIFGVAVVDYEWLAICVVCHSDAALDSSVEN
jgi:hypothetical protein